MYDIISELVLALSEDNEMHSATPLEEDIVLSPSEASVKIGVFDVKALDPNKNSDYSYCSEHDQKGRNPSIWWFLGPRPLKYLDCR